MRAGLIASLRVIEPRLLVVLVAVGLHVGAATPGTVMACVRTLPLFLMGSGMPFTSSP